MSSIKFSVRVSDRVTKRFERAALPEVLEEGRLQGGRDVRHLFYQHFRAKNLAEPNQFFRRHGGRRLYFWRRMANSLQEPVLNGEGQVVLAMHRDIAQKRFGGPILPKRARALTIPVHQDAYGRSARRLESFLGTKLFIVKTKRGRKTFLAAKGGPRGGLRRYYLLRSSVNQEPWPDTFPPRKQITAAFKEGFRSVLNRED